MLFHINTDAEKRIISLALGNGAGLISIEKSFVKIGSTTLSEGINDSFKLKRIDRGSAIARTASSQIRN